MNDLAMGKLDTVIPHVMVLYLLLLEDDEVVEVEAEDDEVGNDECLHQVR